MANSTYIYNDLSKVYLGVHAADPSQPNLLSLPSTDDDAVPFKMIPASAGEYSICATGDDGQSSCLEVWNLRDTAIHVGPPNTNGSQFWMMMPVSGGYKLSNYNAGPGMYLDVNSTSNELMFSQGDWTGQLWSNKVADAAPITSISSTTSQSATPTPTSMSTLMTSSITTMMTSSAASSTFLPSATDAPTLQSSAATAPQAKHNQGAIIAVAVGCSLVPIIFASLVIALWMRRRKARKELENVDFIHVGGSWSRLSGSGSKASTRDW